MNNEEITLTPEELDIFVKKTLTGNELHVFQAKQKLGLNVITIQKQHSNQNLTIARWHYLYAQAFQKFSVNLRLYFGTEYWKKKANEIDHNYSSILEKIGTISNTIPYHFIIHDAVIDDLDIASFHKTELFLIGLTQDNKRYLPYNLKTVGDLIKWGLKAYNEHSMPIAIREELLQIIKTGLGKRTHFFK